MPLFQNSVVTKHLNAQNKETIAAKWAIYSAYFLNPAIQENIRNSKEEQYQGEFLIDLFVNVLGYTKNPTPNFNLTTELKNEKDSKKADGGIIVNDIVVGVIELKGTNTTDLNKIEVQAFGYKNNQKDCVYVITSNFEKLRFYIDNAIENVEFNLFQLTEVEFELLYLCLAFENLSKNIPKKIKDESINQENLITKQLYKDYSLFKNSLFHNLTDLNPQYEPLELFKKSQKLIDRFLFLLFGEDRQLLPPNSVRLILDDWKDLQDRDVDIPLYDRYKKYFEYLNTGYKGKRYDVFAYNGGLFKADEILDSVKIDDTILFDHTIKLAAYDFASEVDVNILGHIFENSLNELDEMKARLDGVEIDKSTTKRKKDGVFYTPKYITKYIVANTVGQLCTEKKSELQIVEEEYSTEKKRTKATKQPLLEKLTNYRNWLLQITIIDPACGSGAFLNEALNFLIAEHAYIDELQAKLFGDAMIMSDVEKSILENNLFGVDFNEESVEIAKLSLWLRTAQPNRKLNDLNHNIKCGNSLIDDPEIAGDKAFNWQNEFPQIFERGGFDVVIGNPPYVDIKALDSADVKYFFRNYETCENRINLYSIFIEMGFNILNDKGTLSYINPNSMLVNSSYFKLRKLILPYLNKIVKLPDDVFADAKVETIIFELFKNPVMSNINVINYSKDEQISDIDNSRTVEFDRNIWLEDSNINFNLYASKAELIILAKVEDPLNIELSRIADFTLGITPYDKYTGHTPEIIKTRAFHSTIKVDDSYKPVITGENITRYFVGDEVKEYIKYGDWLGAKREERFFTTPRILVRQIVSGNPPRMYCGYTEFELYFTQIGFAIITKDQHQFANKYLLALLNSTLINFYHKYKFLDLEKNLFQKVLIANCKAIPIVSCTHSLQNPFVEKVDTVLMLTTAIHEISKKFQRTVQRKFDLEDLPKKLQDWYNLSYSEFIKELAKKKVKLSLSDEAEWEEYFNSESKKALELKAQIDATDKEIDQMVYELYGLSEEEIEIVENS